MGTEDWCVWKVGSGRMCWAVRSAPATGTSSSRPGTRTPVRASPSTLPVHSCWASRCFCRPSSKPCLFPPAEGVPPGSWTHQSPLWLYSPTPHPPFPDPSPLLHPVPQSPPRDSLTSSLPGPRQPLPFSKWGHQKVKEDKSLWFNEAIRPHSPSSCRHF